MHNSFSTAYRSSYGLKANVSDDMQIGVKNINYIWGRCGDEVTKHLLDLYIYDSLRTKCILSDNFSKHLPLSMLGPKSKCCVVFKNKTETAILNK